MCRTVLTEQLGVKRSATIPGMWTLIGAAVITAVFAVLVLCVWKGWGAGEDPYPELTAEDQRGRDEQGG